jgi:hypothetical protein
VRDRPQKQVELLPGRKADKTARVSSILNFCTAYNKGQCSFGDKCRYAHRCSRVMGAQEDGAPHYCNARHSEKEHDTVVGKRKKGSGKGSKGKLRRRGTRGGSSGSKGGGGKR